MQVRPRKLLLVFLLGVALVIEVISLVLFSSESIRHGVVLYFVRAVFGLYLALLSALLVRQGPPRHWRLILHLSALTSVAMVISAVLLVVPPDSGPMSWRPILSRLVLLRYAIPLAYASACLTVITIPRGPPLHFPSERIYSDKTLMDVTSKYEDNVCGSVNASVWDSLLFSYTTRIIMLGNLSESLEIGDLPIVPANMRATYLFASMRATMNNWKFRVRTWSPKPGSGWELAYRIICVNAGTLTLLVALSVSVAILYYIPAFFLQRVVEYVERDPARENKSWGWVFSAGLFISSAIWQIGTSASLFHRFY